MVNLQAVVGDITELKVDAIVNAANSSLLGGGGVDGAIHRAAGPKLLAECRSLNGCDTGQAKVTAAYNLPSRYVIHTVGPIWQGGKHGEEDLLAGCYTSCLSEASRLNLATIAFPAISTGVYGYPLKAATDIAVSTVYEDISDSGLAVIFVCFDEDTYRIYQEVIARWH